MKYIAIMALLGATEAAKLSKHHHHRHLARYPEDDYYGNGNAGRHPHETADAFWHAAHNTPDTDAFHQKVAEQGAYVRSSNAKDTAPTYHNNGASLVQYPSHWGPNGTPVPEANKAFHLWTNGNGAGSEKQDVWWDMAHHAESEEQFHNWARYPDLHSENSGDSEPKMNKNGFFIAAQTG